MIGQSLWKNLKSLVTLDKQIENLKEEIDRTEKIIEKDKKNFPKLEEQLEKSKQNYLTEKKNVTQHELNAKELKDKETEKKDLLEKISNPKEYKATEKELKSLSQKLLEQDDLLIKVWHQLEQTEKKFEKDKKEKEEQIQQLKEGFEVQIKLLGDLQAKKSELIKKRNDATKNIPQNWLDKYENMRHKVADPIVPVLGSSCSACYYAILRQDLAKLKKAGVLPCRNCYRFLYYDEEEEKESTEQKY